MVYKMQLVTDLHACRRVSKYFRGIHLSTLTLARSLAHSSSNRMLNILDGLFCIDCERCINLRLNTCNDEFLVFTELERVHNIALLPFYS